MALAKELQGLLARDGEDATLWSEAFPASQPFLISLRDQLQDGFGVFVLGTDDVKEVQGGTVLVPRDNVVFEAGMSVGALGLRRTLFLSPSSQQLHLPTDLQGVSQLRYEHIPDAEVGNVALRNQCRALVTGIVGHINNTVEAEGALAPAPQADSSYRPAGLYVDAADVSIDQVLAARATLDAVGSSRGMGLGSFVSHRLFGHGRIVGKQADAGSTKYWVEFPAGPCLLSPVDLALLL